MIALGVTGGIGAYKAVEVARGLQKNGHDVVAIMTASATRFVGPITFEAITRHRVITDQFEPGANADIEHIALASSIDLLLVAPATAKKPIYTGVEAASISACSRSPCCVLFRTSIPAASAISSGSR